MGTTPNIRVKGVSRMAYNFLWDPVNSFFPSPFDEAVVLTADGVGEWATTTVAVGKGNKLDIQKDHKPR